MASSELTALLPTEAEEDKPAFIDPLSLTSSHRAGILAGIWTATFLASLNMTLVATLLTSISSEYDQANEASWLGTSYLLATATFTPLYGRLCNVLGRRGANQLAVVLLFLGTVGCGFAGSMRQLIAARFIAGCGGGGIFTTASIVTSDLYSMRARSLTQGIASIFSGIGMGLGGPLGGYISDRYGWRLSFTIQLPLFLVAFFLTQSFLTYHTPGKARSPLAILARIDYLGSLALLLTIGCTLFGLSYKFNLDVPWGDRRVWGCFTGAAVGVGAFVLVEIKVAKEPVLAPGLLRMRVPLLVGVNSLFIPLCNFGVMYFFPMWFEVVAGKTSSEAGLHLFPNSISMSAGSLFAGYMMHRTGRYKTLNLVFGILPFIASLLIARLKPDSAAITQWLSIVPLGFGNAVVLQTTLIALLVSIDHSQLAVGTGFVQLFRGIGQVLGVAIPSAIFQYKLDKELRSRVSGPGSAELILRIRHNSRVVNELPMEVQREARKAFAVSLRAVFLFGAACTLLAFLIRLPIPEQSLDSPQGHYSDSDDSEEEDNEEFTSSPPLLSPVAEMPAPDLLPPPNHSIASSPRPRPRRLSTYESDDGRDLEPNAVPRSWRSSRNGSGFRVGSLGGTSVFGLRSARESTVGEGDSDEER